MNRQEFIRYLRENFPEYSDMGDDELYTKASKLPQFSGWITSPVSHQTKGVVADRIGDLKGKKDSSFFGFFTTGKLERTLFDFDLREKIAGKLNSLEDLERVAKWRAVNTTLAEYEAQLSFAAREALYENQVAVTRKATEEGIPADKYGEILLRVAEYKVHAEMQRLQMQLKLQELYEADKQGIELAALENDRHFAYLDQISNRIGDLEVEILQLEEAKELPAKTAVKKRELEHLTRQYDERLKRLALPEENG